MLSMIIIFIALVVVVNQSINPSNTYSKVRYGMGSWPIKYNSLRELTISSNVDVIVIGVIMNAESYEEKAIDASEAHLICTKYSFKVQCVLKGPQDLDVIEIHQTGGTINGETLILLDDPPMHVDDVLILFLHEWEPSKYYIEGGPQGRFVVKDGKVYSLGEIEHSAEALTSHLKTNGILLNQFIKSIVS